MLGTALAALVLLFAVQALLVVKVADKLSGKAAVRPGNRTAALLPRRDAQPA